MVAKQTKSTKKSRVVQLPTIEDLKASVEKLGKDIDETVQDFGKRAVKVLPAGSRKQVDEVVDRLNAVRDDVNKAVDGVRHDIEKRVKVIRGDVEGRVSKVRKETETRAKKLVSSVEKEARKYVERAYKQLKLPVRSDLEALKRRLTNLERRIEAIEKAAKSAAKRVAA